MTRSFESLKKLSTREKILLRNALGRSISSPGIQNMAETYAAFYRSSVLNWENESKYKVNREDPYFVAVCIWCFQGENGNVEFAEAWAKYVNSKNSESLKKRLNKLLNTEYGDLFISQLAGMIRMLHADGINVNCETLAEDIWNFYWDKQRIQRKWYRIIYKDTDIAE